MRCSSLRAVLGQHGTTHYGTTHYCGHYLRELLRPDDSVIKPHAQRMLPRTVTRLPACNRMARGDAPPREGARLTPAQPRRQQLQHLSPSLGAVPHHRTPAVPPAAQWLCQHHRHQQPTRPGAQCLCALTEFHLPPPRPRSALHRPAVGRRGRSGAPARGPPHLVVAAQRGVQAREAIEASSIHQRPSLFSHGGTTTPSRPTPLKAPKNRPNTSPARRARKLASWHHVIMIVNRPFSRREISRGTKPLTVGTSV